MLNRQVIMYYNTAKKARHDRGTIHRFIHLVGCFRLPPAFNGVVGSAMTELAFDIASGANFKFNTMFQGRQVHLQRFAF